MIRRAGVRKGFAAGFLLVPLMLAAAEKTDAPAPAIQVKFIPGPKQMLLQVEKNPKGWPPDAPAGGRLEILLRLPFGVKLESEGWSPVPLPEGERKDGSEEIWSAFEQTRAIEEDPKEPDQLAKIPLKLKVAEDGINWIITARVKLTQGQKNWTGFGTIFATRQGGMTEFHTAPKRPDAQTNGY